MGQERMDMSRMAPCLSYFQGKSVFQKLFVKMAEKYKSLGHMGGSVTLTGLSMEDKEQLGGFLRKNYRGNRTVTVSAAAFQQSLDESRFAGIRLEELLAVYFDRPMIGRREEVLREEDVRNRYFAEIIADWETQNREVQCGAEGSCEEAGDSCRDPSGAVHWIRQILADRNEGYRLLMQQYREDAERLRLILFRLFQASVSLPKDAGAAGMEQLPVFAARVTGDPHWFDETTVSGRLLLLYLGRRYQLVRDAGMSGPEWRSTVLFSGGILKDALSNTVLVYGICGRDRAGIHPGIQGFFQRQEPFSLTLKTLGGMSDVWPGDHGRRIFVIENPAVFQAIVEAVPSVCAVCSNGQPRLAVLVLLDFLMVHGIIYYAGDFDPEGLQIAQRLKQRYGDRLEFWCYQRSFYERSRMQEPLPQERLRKLETVMEEGLAQVRDAMLAAGCAAYQERLLDEYIRYLKI